MRALALAASLPWLLAATAPRQAVYTFTYVTNRTDEAAHAYGVDKMDPGGGGTFYFHNVNRHYITPVPPGVQTRTGTIAVDFLREDASGGWVVRVREGPAPPSGSTPATCVAFADATVVCDTDSVGPEALALLAVLGKGFFDPARLDAARHWHVDAQGAYGTTADYTVAGSAGALVDIHETGVRTEKALAPTTIGATIQYDPQRSLPASLDESTVQRTLRGAVYETISTQATLKLESDSANPR